VRISSSPESTTSERQRLRSRRRPSTATNSAPTSSPARRRHPDAATVSSPTGGSSSVVSGGGAGESSGAARRARFWAAFSAFFRWRWRFEELYGLFLATAAYQPPPREPLPRSARGPGHSRWASQRRALGDGSPKHAFSSATSISRAKGAPRGSGQTARRRVEAHGESVGPGARTDNRAITDLWLPDTRRPTRRLLRHEIGALSRGGRHQVNHPAR
jgi:hypothetical protein